MLLNTHLIWVGRRSVKSIAVTEMKLIFQVNKGTTLALQVDQDGIVRYDAIAQHGRAAGSKVQSSFKGKLLFCASGKSKLTL